MKRAPLTLLAILVLVAPVLGTAGSPAAAMPDGNSRQSFRIWPTQLRHDIYTPSSPSDYRTSASIFRSTPTEPLNQLNCGPESGSGIQVIRLTTSQDGASWGPETVVLRPTPNGPDAYGVCDPNVVKAGLYYYLAYTGFDRARHAVFLARSPSLSQPWQKWNGEGWGGPRPPAPIVAASSLTGFGVGHPSMIVQPGAMLIYYGFHNGTTWQTRVVSAPLRSDNVVTWPREIIGGTTVLAHPGSDAKNVCGRADDSTDVAYDDIQGKYVAVTTDSKSFADSSLETYESPTGLRFTKALTVGMHGYGNVVEDHAHHVSIVRDAQGHFKSTPENTIVYDYGPERDCPNRLRWQVANTGSAATGWIREPLNNTEHWDLAAGHWWISGETLALQGELVSYDDPARAYLKTNQVSDTATIDLDYKQSPFPFGLYSGISFGSPLLGVGSSAYYVRFYTSGRVTLSHGDQVLATGATSASAQFITNHMQVVISQNTITVYNGVGHDALTNPIIHYTSATDLYPSGYIGLESGGVSHFSNLTVRDDVPAGYVSQDENVLDWKQSTGDWKVRAPSTISSYDASTGQTFLQGRADPVSNYNAHLGDGTYTATVQLNPGSPASSWGGLNVANGAAQAYLNFTTGGYLVFLRANGNLGLWKGGGPGQVVPDVPTGLNPIPTPVKIRVVKVGANIQVYLGGSALPTINYTDPGPPFVTGGFGLATYGAGGVFTNVAYAGNNGV
jgi:hypothetical protein